MEYQTRSTPADLFARFRSRNSRTTATTPAAAEPPPSAPEPLPRDDRLTAIIRQQAGLHHTHTDITPETTLASLGLDSLDEVQIIMDLEEAFRISIPNETMEALMEQGELTVGNLRQMVESLHSRQPETVR